MKSLVEEASSIFKALEKAWERAGKPESFSVKIFEEPVKTFFGFTKKDAKVGLFFEEQHSLSHAASKKVEQGADGAGHRSKEGNSNRPQHHDRNNNRRPHGQRSSSGQRQQDGTRMNAQKQQSTEQRANRQDDGIRQEVDLGGEQKMTRQPSQRNERRSGGHRSSSGNQQRSPRHESHHQGASEAREVVQKNDTQVAAPHPVAQKEEPAIERRVLRVSNRQYDATVKKDE